MTSFVSVATSAARFQDISLNPQKLAGQCAKLKCCLNYEVDAYVESQKKLPSREVVLETKMGSYYHFKTDIFKRQLTYSTSKDVIANLVTIDADRVFEIIALNKRGIKPDELVREGSQEPVRKEFEDVVGQDSLTRFDKTRKKNNRKGKGNGNGVNNQGGNKRQGAETRDERRSQNRQENREPGNNNRPKKRNNGLNRNGNNNGGNNNGGNNNNNVRNNNSVNNNNESKDKENEKPAE